MHQGEGAHLRVNGIRQHYLHFPGPGPCVVIVPGIVSPAILWRHVGAWLSEDHDCYILDVRGRGLSEAGPHLDYGMDACARDVVAFIEAMQLPAPIVVGHSMGGRIAMRTAAHAPGLIGAVVLVDPPTSGPGRQPYPVPKARTLDLLRAAQRGEALPQGAGAPWPPALQALRAEWLATCDERAVHAAYDDFHGEDLYADIARTDTPLSLLCAGQGGVVSEADVAQMRQLRDDLAATRLAGVGHQMQAENFDAFKQALGDMLARHLETMERKRN